MQSGTGHVGYLAGYGIAIGTHTTTQSIACTRMQTAHQCDRNFSQPRASGQEQARLTGLHLQQFSLVKRGQHRIQPGFVWQTIAYLGLDVRRNLGDSMVMVCILLERENA